MLAEALKAEADAFVASFAHEQLEDGRQRIVRHGFGPERQIQTGIGACLSTVEVIVRCSGGHEPLCSAIAGRQDRYDALIISSL